MMKSNKLKTTNSHAHSLILTLHSHPSHAGSSFWLFSLALGLALRLALSLHSMCRRVDLTTCRVTVVLYAKPMTEQNSGWSPLAPLQLIRCDVGFSPIGILASGAGAQDLVQNTPPSAHPHGSLISLLTQLLTLSCAGGGHCVASPCSLLIGCLSMQPSDWLPLGAGDPERCAAQQPVCWDHGGPRRPCKSVRRSCDGQLLLWRLGDGECAALHMLLAPDTVVSGIQQLLARLVAYSCPACSPLFCSLLCLIGMAVRVPNL